MKTRFGYGKTHVELELDEKNVLALLAPNDVRGAEDEVSEVRRALANPIGAPRLRDIVKPSEKVAVITSDITRPMPTNVVLPVLLDELFAAGAKAEDIFVVFALGNHRGHTEEERRRLMGDAYGLVRCMDTDQSDCVRLGSTNAGTDINIFRPVAEADRRICLGNIEYHYFAGYSGGAKALIPGVSTRETIRQNHRFMIHPDACTGKIDGPVRSDLEEVSRFLPADAIVNVVLDEKKKIVHAVCGDIIQAHRAGCAFLDALYKIRIRRQADIVVVSPGGYPKDLNMYQAQKALDNARHAVKEGGVIIWAAACTEGLGESCFERWMTSFTPKEMIAEIQRNFELGGHKAAAIALVLERARIMLVSDLPDALVSSLHLEPKRSVQEAYDDAAASFAGAPSVLLMPYGGSTLPDLA